MGRWKAEDRELRKENEMRIDKAILKNLAGQFKHSNIYFFLFLPTLIFILNSFIIAERESHSFERLWSACFDYSTVGTNKFTFLKVIVETSVVHSLVISSFWRL